MLVAHLLRITNSIEPYHAQAPCLKLGTPASSSVESHREGDSQWLVVKTGGKSVTNTEESGMRHGQAEEECEVCGGSCYERCVC